MDARVGNDNERRAGGGAMYRRIARAVHDADTQSQTATVNNGTVAKRRLKHPGGRDDEQTGDGERINSRREGNRKVVKGEELKRWTRVWKTVSGSVDFIAGRPRFAFMRVGAARARCKVGAKDPPLLG